MRNLKMQIRKDAEELWKKKPEAWPSDPIEELGLNEKSYALKLRGQVGRNVKCENKSCCKTYVARKTMLRQAKQVHGK